MKDDDGNLVGEGDKIHFSYGIPGVRVDGTVVKIGSDLWVLTPGHNPDKCRLVDLRKYVGHFWKTGRLDAL